MTRFIPMAPVLLLALLSLAAPLGAQGVNDTTETQTRFIIVDRLVVQEEIGIIKLGSSFDVPQTVDRLRTLIELKGLSIYAEIDHQLEAKRAGRTMPPMRLLLFGGPTAMTMLLPEARTLGLDLPYTILVYRGDSGGTIIAYDDPAWLARRHGINDETSEVRRIAGVLNDIARSAGGDS
jgi:uncharacterized protein (DUF302 family)